MQITISNDLATLLNRRCIKENVKADVLVAQILEKELQEYQIPLIASIRVIETMPAKTGGHFMVTDELFTKLTDVYDPEYIKIQLKAMKLWLDTNPAKRKTHRGMPKFITTWLNKNDTGGARNECKQQLNAALDALKRV